MDITMLMAFSDYLILDAIRSLADCGTITYADIAAAMPTPCCTKTVQRSVKRLMDVGQISRTGSGRSMGYRYHIMQQQSGAA